MKKKIKDLTSGEMNKICTEHLCICSRCPLCYPVDGCLKGFLKKLKYLETKVELEK